MTDKKVTAAEVGAVLGALRNAAACLDDYGSKIHFEYDGANCDRSWTVQVQTSQHGHGVKAHGKTFEAVVADLSAQIECALHAQEDKLKRNAETVRGYLKKARGEE